MSTLLVVPARGGSVGIPKKATRLLGEKPVLLHTLDAIRGLGFVVVTTDDEEIEKLATAEGVTVHRESKSDGKRTLDPVIAAAIHHFQGPDIIATVQCTSPFLRRATIERCLAAIRDDGFDTALTVRDDRGLRWERAKLETTKAAMPARLTRQAMPPTWRETGGCLVTWRCHVTAYCRIGPKVKLVPVQGREALDLDSRDDWLLAEAYAREAVPA